MPTVFLCGGGGSCVVAVGWGTGTGTGTGTRTGTGMGMGTGMGTGTGTGTGTGPGPPGPFAGHLEEEPVVAVVLSCEFLGDVVLVHVGVLLQNIEFDGDVQQHHRRWSDQNYIDDGIRDLLGCGQITLRVGVVRYNEADRETGEGREGGNGTEEDGGGGNGKMETFDHEEGVVDSLLDVTIGEVEGESTQPARSQQLLPDFPDTTILGQVGEHEGSQDGELDRGGAETTQVLESACLEFGHVIAHRVLEIQLCEGEEGGWGIDRHDGELAVASGEGEEGRILLAHRRRVALAHEGDELGRNGGNCLVREPCCILECAMEEMSASIKLQATEEEKERAAWGAKERRASLLRDARLAQFHQQRTHRGKVATGLVDLAALAWPRHAGVGPGHGIALGTASRAMGISQHFAEEFKRQRTSWTSEHICCRTMKRRGKKKRRRTESPANPAARGYAAVFGRKTWATAIGRCTQNVG
ncbi:hypothetical protein C8F01DRAFT_1094632 [Mycena amicta]|nr:hypothetical protein C8F01DRAFT_1094632 [Mycena amicta]